MTFLVRTIPACPRRHACPRRLVGSAGSARRTAVRGPVARLAGFVVALAAPLLAAPAAFAQDTPPQLLEDFVHYTMIARTDLALAKGQALLESGVTNAELALLVEEGEIDFEQRFDAAVGRGLMVAELEPLVADITRRVELGRLELARDGDRIDHAIGMMIGTQRQKMLANGRLEAAGEFAVPALLQVITDGREDRLQLASRDMLLEIGLHAASPLCAALPELDPRSQRMVCEILGEIRYPHAAPYLREL